MIRLFVAVNLSPEALAACGRELQRVEQALGHHAADVRFPRPEGLHFTIKFLGWTPEDQVELVREALTQAAAQSRPFDVTLAGLEAFPSMKRPRVLFLGATEGAAQMRQLAMHVEEQLAPLGFPTEKRPFTAHLTLGRIKYPRLSMRVGERFAEIAPQEAARFRVEKVELMQSELSHGGSRYTVLAECALGASTAGRSDSARASDPSL